MSTSDPTATTDVQTPREGETEAEWIERFGEGPVRLGSILCTLIEPHRGWERAYNRWYERDHLYAGCTVGPYNFAAKRWVATRAHKDLRFMGDGTIVDDAMVGSYLALYWIQQGHRQDWNRWAYREFKDLHENGRMFPHREHVHTLLYDHDHAVYRDDDPVPAALVLDHPYAGLVVTIGTATTSRGDFDAWYADWARERFAGTAAASTLVFSGVPLLVDAQDVAKDDGDTLRFLHLTFVDADPAEVWDDVFASVPAEFAAAGHGEVLWQGGFIPTIPGTDTHTDDLW